MWVYLGESCTDSTYSRVLGGSQKLLKATSIPLPIVNEIGTPSGFCSLGCTQGTYQPHQSGMTYSLFMEPCSHVLTSSMEDSPAKTLALPDGELAWTESEADYFSRSQGSLAKYDHDSSSWKTSQRLLFEDQNESLESFAASGMTVDGEFYPLKMWERITDEKGGGFLPTPTVGMVTGGQNPEKGGQVGLGYMARKNKWPTPDCSDRRSAKSKQQVLSNMVKKYPTPAARDWKDNGRSPAELNRNSTTLATEAGGSLNPTWVEWLMGYHSGWTVLEPWATAWWRSARERRSRG